MGTLGVIDTLTAAFNTVTKRLGLVIIPVFLDLFLWLGPKLSIAPVIEKTVNLFRLAMESVPTSVSPDANPAGMFEMMLDTLQNTVGQTNLLALLAWGRLGVPSVAGMRPIGSDADWVIEIAEYGQMFLLQLLILAVGLLIACIFLGMLAQTAGGEGLSLAKLSRRIGTYWLYMAAIFVPLSIALIFGLSTGILLGAFGIFIGAMILWMMLYVSFVPHAITLGQEKPLRALWSSFSVVRFNFWPALGLILLTNVINTGLGLVWHRLLMNSAIGTLVAIVANAYVGTALTLALFIFYRDHVRDRSQSLGQQRSV